MIVVTVVVFLGILAVGLFLELIQLPFTQFWKKLKPQYRLLILIGLLSISLAGAYFGLRSSETEPHDVQTKPIPTIPVDSIADFSMETFLDFDIDQTNMRLHLTNSGNKDISWQATASQLWIAVEPNSGFLRPSQTAIMRVEVARLGKPLGTYEGLVTVVADGMSKSTLVRMALPVPPDVFPKSLLFEEATSFDTVTVAQPQTGGVSLDFHVQTDEDWLKVNPNTFRLSPPDRQILTLAVNLNDLEPGLNSGIVDIQYDGVISNTLRVLINVVVNIPVYEVVESLNGAKSWSANFDLLTESFVNAFPGPRLGTLSCSKTDTQFQTREYFLQFNWQIPSNAKVVSAYLDLAPYEFGEYTEYLQITPVQIPYPFVTAGISQSYLLELSELRNNWIHDIGALSHSLRVENNLAAKSIKLTQAVTSVHREGGSFIVIHVWPKCSQDDGAYEKLFGVLFLERLFIHEPKLTIRYVLER